MRTKHQELTFVPVEVFDSDTLFIRQLVEIPQCRLPDELKFP